VHMQKTVITVLR